MVGMSASGPGAIRVRPGEIEINTDRAPDERGELTVTNTGDRPIQVGSHFHLADANPALDFDRDAAEGFGLDVAAGTSVRFEPGASRRVAIVAFKGRKLVHGLQVRRPRA